MASAKAEKPIGTQLFGQKEAAAKPIQGSSKAPAAPKSSAPKRAAQKPQESKKKVIIISPVSFCFQPNVTCYPSKIKHVNKLIYVLNRFDREKEENQQESSDPMKAGRRPEG
ncbi:hypothetical protein Dimus_031187 [Dionaea muscipula]